MAVATRTRKAASTARTRTTTAARKAATARRASTVGKPIKMLTFIIRTYEPTKTVAALESLKEKGLLANFEKHVEKTTKATKATIASVTKANKEAKAKARVLESIAQGAREVKMAMAGIKGYARPVEELLREL